MRRGGVVATLVPMVIMVGAVVGALVLFNRPGWSPDATAGQGSSDGTSAHADGALASLRESDGHWGRVATYPVIGDGTLNPLPSGLAAEIWAAFSRIATPEYVVGHLRAFLVADAPGDPTTASVERTATRAPRWTLTMNLANASRRDAYLRALVHEYAHLLTLDENQVLTDSGRCATTLVQEGCLVPGSTLERFEERFWERYGSEAPDPDSSSRGLAWRMFVAHTADFVTAYAATNVVEDAAETFAEFVIRKQPDPNSGPWARKVLFFWEDPTYLEIREHIRSWFADELPVLEIPSR